ncbi:ArnT family glycosyltransferase [Sunxiuqinia indica]|uniref:ArnT family glycosyltransferase n=1 Tax=Sunxiuqinia indica TaxID=2692584 RepID=UPI001F449583|nr:glycosyltransferase family 39 protein [Sunxiuqinia indica]
MKVFKDRQVLVLFLITAVVLRLFSFFTSVLDHDESTYLIIGRDLLNGKLLYYDVIDSKPVGIFAIYAFMGLLFGHSIVMSRLFVALIVGVTAHLLFLVSKKILNNQPAALATGFIYICCTSTWNYFGLSPNTELFFNFFTAFSLLFLLKKSSIRYGVAGVLMGIGFIIKYLVLFDFVALMSFLLVYEIMQRRSRFSCKDFLPFLFSGVGFALPFLMVNLYFFVGNYFEHFRFITYDLPGRYMQQGTTWRFVKLLLDFSGRFFPVTFLIFYVLFSKQKLLKPRYKYLVNYWIAAILLAIYLPGKGFSHYAIQLMIPISLIVGVAFHSEFRLGKYARFFFRGKTGMSFGILLLLVIQVVGIRGKIVRPDEPEVIADYLQKRITHEDNVFVANYEQIVYLLLEKECPTKYVHSSILNSPHLSMAFNVNPELELIEVLKKKPKYILIENKFELLEKMIHSDYILERSFFNEKVRAYRRVL